MSLRSIGRSIKTSNAKGQPETLLSVRVTTLAAVLIAANATLQQDVGAPALRLAIPAGLIVAFTFSYLARFRPGYGVKFLLALGMMAASVHFVGQLAGIGQNAAAAQRPLAELFLWTQLLHSFDVPARRDLRFSLAASTVLLGVGGVLSISSGFAVSLVLWAAAAGTALTLMQRGEWLDLPGPTATRSRYGAFGALAATGTAAVLLTGGIFLLLPASGTARSFTFPTNLPSLDRIPGGGLVNPSLGGSGGDGTTAATDPAEQTPRASFGFVGFSKELDTAARGRPDDTVVMRVRASKPGFWRGQSFDTWDGRRWVASSDKPRLTSGEGAIDLPRFEGDVSNDDAEEFVQTVYVDKPGPNLVFGAAAATKLYFPDRSVLVLPDGTVRAGVHLDKGAVYTVISKRPIGSPDALTLIPFSSFTAANGLGMPAKTAYTQLPTGMPTRIADLAASVTADSPSLYGKVRAIEAWLGRNTTYSIDTPPLPAGSDAVDTFLFDQKVGFCEQIASSLVVMLRSLGVPARLGVGYASGDRNPFTGLYEVKASDAHAWAEVYFPGTGWLTFDPTANVPFADDGEIPLARDGLSTFIAAKLGPALSLAGQLAIVLTFIATLGAASWFIRRSIRCRQKLAARSWPEVWNDRLDQVGSSLGVPRQPGQTARTYLTSLGLCGSDWDDALATLDQASFATMPVDEVRRGAADRTLKSAATNGSRSMERIS